jgi:tripartite-type tricarboxylate transporter receptor subunit TctC
MKKTLLATLVLALATPVAALAQSWPSRPIKLIVPFSAGGTTDIVARTVADRLGRELGQPVVVDNRAGAAGAIGSDLVAKAAPDGYTIGMATVTTHAVNPAVFKKLAYDVLRDLAPVTQLVAVPNIMTVRPAPELADMAKFVAVAKAAPGKLSYGSPGPGSEANLMGELFNHSAGVKLMHVPYKGAAPALQDAMAGQIDVVFDNLPSSLPFVQGGKLRALAVAAPQRIPQLPNVPTFAEVGLSSVNDTSWFGLVAPAKTPADIVRRIQEASAKVLAQPDVQQTLDKFGGVAVGSKPEAFTALLRSELAKFKQLADTSGIQLD